MKFSGQHLRLVTLLWCVLVAAPGSVAALECGDADGDGVVSVTDGVTMLRAAAQLPSDCPRRRCDMNLDGEISVTDGVGGLRLAAGLSTQAECSEARTDALFGQIYKTIGFGVGAAATARAQGAQTTPCPNGGFTEDEANLTRFVDCRDGNIITNGTIQTTDTAPNRFDVDYSLSDRDAETGEVSETTGTLSFAEFEFTVVNGTLRVSSNVAGLYELSYFDVFLDDENDTDGGQIIISFIEGPVAVDVSQIELNIYSTGVFQAVIIYVDEQSETYIFGDTICTPCSEEQPCDDSAAICAPCIVDCTGSTPRCTIDFDVLDCGDGGFGPADVCKPCAEESDCSLNLLCEPCSAECTGTVSRCASPTAFVHCEDGSF